MNGDERRLTEADVAAISQDVVRRLRRRKEPALDVPAVVDAAVRTALWMCEHPEVVGANKIAKEIKRRRDVVLKAVAAVLAIREGSDPSPSQDPSGNHGEPALRRPDEESSDPSAAEAP